MNKFKFRVRLCLKDIYRFIAIGKAVTILGIDAWTATTNAIYVKYEGDRRTKRYKTVDEDARREAIKQINKYISEVH